MKKLLFFAVAALTWTACGNKANSAVTDADSTEVFEVPDTLNTVESVVKQVNAVYDYLAHFDAEKGMPWLDERFGTKAWREANTEVDQQKDVQADDEDEGFWVNGYDPWTRECYEGKITISDIKAELQADGTAKVTFKMKDAMMTEPEDVGWTMRVEDGEWRVDDMLDGDESLRDKMSRWLAEREQTLPNTAVQKDESAEVILYTNLDIAASENSNSQTSVWLKYKKSGKVRFLFNTNNDAKPRWDEMKDGNGISVPIEDIAAGECDNCRLIPWDKDKIFVEGCPDSRNIWSYIYDIRNQNAIQLPSTEGLLDIDAANRLFNMSLYRYHPEGGRYSVKRSYTIDGKYTGKEQVLEDSE